MKSISIHAATMFVIAFGNLAFAQGHHHGNWPDSLETIEVSGTVIVDNAFSHGLYYLDINNDGVVEYLLSFGPWWYEPANGATRPNDGATVTIVGAVMDAVTPPLVVFEINGLEWREPIEFGSHGWNGQGLWEDHGDTLTVAGTVFIDTTYFYPHYFLDVDGDTIPEYQLGFGPPWYEPASDAARPNDGDQVTIFGRLHDAGMMGNDMLVVISIDGLEWRPLDGPAPWAGTWMHRDDGDTVRAYCVNDSGQWVDFPPGHMGGGMMGHWPDSMFVQFWRIHTDSLPGQHHEGRFAAYYLDVDDPQGQSMMGRQMGWGPGHMRFGGEQHFRFQYRDEDMQAHGLDESRMALHIWNAASQQWQEISGAVIDTPTNTVTLASADLNNYYALFAPPTATGIESPAAGSVPDRLVLQPNYPNPFNPATTISFQLPAQSLVKLEVFNLLGQKVATLIDEIRPAGSYTLQWRGRDDSQRLVVSGIYLLRLEAGEQVRLRRMTMMK